ncbi:MAG: hypothetical protein EBZ61_10835, partial [Micrococcales bacterium]|nr:hypothetical protein [Micrococcales bacterium]
MNCRNLFTHRSTPPIHPRCQPPTKLVGIKDVSHIACGGSHTIASDKKGQVYTWGFGGT